MTSLLPDSSFVTFRALRVATPKLAWLNRTVARDCDPLRHAYCLPIAGESSDAYAAESRLYAADRYGGEAIGHNGGGVRCGMADGVQIKGIGKNPLAGSKTEFWHSYGGAALEEGVREAVWGEVCNIALPYRASRVLALIETGTRIPYRDANGERTARRILVLRRPSVRPAHYMRAVYFKPADHVAAWLPPDVRRTKEAVLAIGRSLAAFYGGTPAHEQDTAHINRCLEGMFQRFAVQLGAARAKRIMHGALGSSNICLDGRWIDFGSITTVSDYGRLIAGANDTPDFHRQHESLVPTLNDLLFYLRKFMPRGQVPIVSAEALMQSFVTTLNRRYCVEFVKLTGVPEWRMASIDQGILLAMDRCLTSIVSRGNGEPFRLAPGHTWDMPPKMGRFQLNSILRVAALCNGPQEMQDRLSVHFLDDEPLLARFITCYCALRDAYLAQIDTPMRDHARLFQISNALRLNTPFPQLYRPVFDASVERIAKDGEPLEPFIDSLIRKAKSLLSEPQDGRIDFSSCFDGRIEVDETRGVFADGRPTSLNALVSGMDGFVLDRRETSLLVRQCAALH
jgi:hypothetical protein